jgi:hypothetical protein
MLTKKFRKIEGFSWIGLGVVICFLAWRVHLGSFREPGPGFVAFVSGLFISIVGLIMFLSQVLSGISSDDGFDLGLSFRNISWFRLAYTTVLLFGYAVFLNSLGYILTTFLVMWGLLYDRKKNNWALSFLTSAVIIGVSYLVFDVWLRSQLPRGIFPWW